MDVFNDSIERTTAYEVLFERQLGQLEQLYGQLCGIRFSRQLDGAQFETWEALTTAVYAQLKEGTITEQQLTSFQIAVTTLVLTAPLKQADEEDEGEWTQTKNLDWIH